MVFYYIFRQVSGADHISGLIFYQNKQQSQFYFSLVVGVKLTHNFFLLYKCTEVREIKLEFISSCTSKEENYRFTYLFMHLFSWVSLHVHSASVTGFTLNDVSSNNSAYPVVYVAILFSEFAKLRKTTIRFFTLFCPSVRLSVCPHGKTQT
jgi:hypothetical protein